MSVQAAPRVRPIPTALTTAETNRLRDLAHGQRVLEVGALLGHSTVALASTARQVISVDPHDGYPAHSPRPTLGGFISNLRAAHVDNVVPVIGRIGDVAPWLAPQSFGLVFLDLTGERAATVDALLWVIPKLRHYATLAVHDFGHPAWPGVEEAWRVVLPEPSEVVDTLAIVTRTWH